MRFLVIVPNARRTPKLGAVSHVRHKTNGSDIFTPNDLLENFERNLTDDLCAGSNQEHLRENAFVRIGFKLDADRNSFSVTRTNTIAQRTIQLGHLRTREAHITGVFHVGCIRRRGGCTAHETKGEDESDSSDEYGHAFFKCLDASGKAHVQAFVNWRRNVTKFDQCGKFRARVAGASPDAKVIDVADKPDASSSSGSPEQSATPEHAAKKSESDTKKPEDVVLIHGRNDDGALQILRKKGDELSAGELRPIEEGKPIQGDVVTLRPRKEMPLLCDVEEEVKLPRPKGTKKPAKVASDQYRAGWEKLWGRRARTRKSKSN